MNPDHENTQAAQSQAGTTVQPPEGVGALRVVRDLAPSAVGERWLSLDEARHTSHVIHVIRCEPPAADRVEHVLDRLRKATDPHVLRVDHVERRDQAWIVLTEYPGHSDGVITLDALVAAKGGRLTGPESARGIRHLVDALLHIHTLGVRNGGLDTAQCLVDRHGRVVLELAGVAAAIGGAGTQDQLEREEVCSLGLLGHRLFSGVGPGETRLPRTRIDAAWERWLTRSIASMDGYANIEQAAKDYPAMPLREG